MYAEITFVVFDEDKPDSRMVRNISDKDNLMATIKELVDSEVDFTIEWKPMGLVG